MSDAPQLGGQQKHLTGQEPELSGARPRTVILNDNPITSRGLSTILEAHGFRPSLCIEHGDLAVGALLKSPPNAFITDYRHPGEPFPVIYQRIRQEPTLCCLPIVLVTALAAEDPEVDLSPYRADPLFRLFRFPFEFQEFIETMTLLVRQTPVGGQ